MSYRRVFRLGRACCAQKLIQRNAPLRPRVHQRGAPRRWASSSSSSSSGKTKTLTEILHQVRDGTISPSDASKLLEGVSSANFKNNNDPILESFANLDHGRSKRTGFPEAVFAEGKTISQVAFILDDMARTVNESSAERTDNDSKTTYGNAILATRVSQEMFDGLSKHTFEYGSIEYNPVARIVTMRASSSSAKGAPPQQPRRVVVATAGTTDIPIAEEAAVTLEASGCAVDRVYDAGVAGLHRILRALPKLTHPDVGCVIVAAGMDGALPSVVGGLVSVPVIAVPTSIGYGASFGGVSAMLTMMNSCSPGVGVVNIDNGFGAAALAFKCIQQSSR